MSARLSPELAAIMGAICAQRFGHRQHVHLAFIAAREHADAAGQMRDWIRQIAESHGAPHKYHETITIAWARIVAYHVAADPGVSDFDAFVTRYPALLDKTLLSRHYSAAALRSATARVNWVAPDLVPLPTPPGC
jgi:hypothetical protein